jgi:hypothetical protein
MHVQFKIQYRNNLIDKKDSYLIPCPPSWDDRNYSYGHQPITENYIGGAITVISVFSYGHLSDLLKSDFADFPVFSLTLYPWI